MEDPPEGLTFEEMELWLDRALWRSQLQRLKNDYESVYRDMRDNRLFCITRNPMERRCHTPTRPDLAEPSHAPTWVSQRKWEATQDYFRTAGEQLRERLEYQERLLEMQRTMSDVSKERRRHFLSLFRWVPMMLLDGINNGSGYYGHVLEEILKEIVHLDLTEMN